MTPSDRSKKVMLDEGSSFAGHLASPARHAICARGYFSLSWSQAAGGLDVEGDNEGRWLRVQSLNVACFRMDHGCGCSHCSSCKWPFTSCPPI